MYAGNTVPTEWPKRADRSTYESYAKLPSWHVEEAASLTAGLIPRQSLYLNFRPIDGVPGEPKPYEDAKTWGGLLEETGPVGRVISLLARAQGLSNWGFSGSDLYIAPAEFVDFATSTASRFLTTYAKLCGKPSGVNQKPSASRPRRRRSDLKRAAGLTRFRLPVSSRRQARA